MAQKYSEAQKQSAKKWDAANLDRLSIALPKGSRETIKARAAALGESTNAFIKRAIDCQMERDSGASAPAGDPQEVGVVSLPSGTIKSAQKAAEAAGEGFPQFVARAVETQAKRDEVERKLRGGENDEYAGKLQAD